MKRALVVVFALLAAGTAMALTPGTDLFIPSIAHANGAQPGGVQAQWRADLWVYNPSKTETAAVNLYLLLRGQANLSPLTRPLSVLPGETRYLPDVVLATFGADNTYAGLRITSTVPVAVTGVSYDANVKVVGKGTGSAGQLFSAIPADFAIGLGSATDLVGLDQDSAGAAGQWRSNLALVETTGNPVNLALERFDSLGNVVATSSYHLESFEANQLSYVVTAIGGGDGTNQRVRVKVTAGAGRVVASASRINNASGDPSTVEMLGTHLSGRFQGLLMSPTGGALDGGLQIVIGSAGLTSFKGAATIPCGEESFSVEVASDATSGPLPFNTDGTLSALVTIPYTDGEHVAFTTDWTLTAVRRTDGTWDGTLASTTRGGTGDYAACNAIGSPRQWRAGWIGND